MPKPVAVVENGTAGRMGGWIVADRIQPAGER